MNTPKQILKQLAIVLFVTAATLPTATAGHECDPLLHDARQLKVKAHDLRTGYARHLKANHRWTPCGPEERFYLAVVAFERGTGEIVAALKRNRLHDARHHLLATRGAANRMHHASRYVRLSRCVREDLSKAEKRLCRLESAFGSHRTSRPTRRTHRVAALPSHHDRVPRHVFDLVRVVAAHGGR